MSVPNIPTPIPAGNLPVVDANNDLLDSGVSVNGSGGLTMTGNLVAADGTFSGSTFVTGDSVFSNGLAVGVDLSVTGNANFRRQSIPSNTGTPATLTAALSNATVVCDASTGSYNQPIPQASTVLGCVFRFVQCDTGGNTVTLVPVASNIMNAGSLVLPNVGGILQPWVEIEAVPDPVNGAQWVAK